MDIAEATRGYEGWLRLNTDIVVADLAHKHEIMHDDVFSFFRATFYRWITRLPLVCKGAAEAPSLLGIGDLHIENFGTWRDGEGRLVWGINDFDEAHLYPYSCDLIRLAASVLIAADAKHLAFDGKTAAAAILKSYHAQLAAKAPAPFVLEEDHPHLRALASSQARSPQAFWKKLDRAKAAKVPAKTQKLSDQYLPEGTTHIRHIARTAGAGSLGLPRYVAMGTLGGGLVAREIKARVPAALVWAGAGQADPTAYKSLIENSVRARDPYLWVKRNWLVRRLGPHCERIELAAIARKKPELRVLEAMGAETANIHHASPKALARVLRDLSQRDSEWLFKEASRMAEDVSADWMAWRKTKSRKTAAAT